jgi:hypothetical protein
MAKKIKSDKTDKINPEHYKRGGIETIKYIGAKLTSVEYEGYLRGNVLKYISRYSDKNGVEDLLKCRWYLDELINHLGGGRDN